MGERDWVRVRGIGRERFVVYLIDFLESVGFGVERSESAEPSESRVSAKLSKLNPAIPESGRELAFRVYPTSGGAAAIWELPTDVAESDRTRMDRFARELVAHLERSILTESHGTAKLSRTPGSRLVWERAPIAEPPARSNAGELKGASL